MPDLSRFESALKGRFPEAWVRHHLESFQEAYFAAFDATEVGNHLELLVDLNDERPVRTRARPAAEAGDWWIDVAGYDSFQFLSTLCCLIAVRGFSIVEGKVFTSQPPPAPPREAPRMLRRPAAPPPLVRHPRPQSSSGPDRRRKIVDVFRVHPETPEASTTDWEAFQTELTTLTRLLRDGQFDDVHHRLIGRMVKALDRYRPKGEAPEALEPLDLAIDPQASPYATVVRIGARDSFGFLYLTASALALCGITIEQADIRTQAGRVDDTLWVTDRFRRKITQEPKVRELRLSLILIEHFCSRLPSATNPEAALLHFSRFATDTMARQDWSEEFDALDRPEALDALARVLGESDFLWQDYLLVQPDALLPMICTPAEWNRERTREELEAELTGVLDDTPALEARARAIQQFRDREIFRADVRSILGRSASADQFSAELTAVAEALLRCALRAALDELSEAAPKHADGRPAAIALCALGKCGGRELGFASDIELMLVFADQGLVAPAGASSASAYFDRVVSLLKTLLATRRDGTFELDFRLRPHGRGGPPATSLAAFRSYYTATGSAWGYERQALIKLRAVAGDEALGREVEALRDAFVYAPEPFDLAGHRRMRSLQVEQLVKPGRINAKFSPGALVDIEYFVQALQIAHGASDPSLRSPTTLRALDALGAAGWLSAEQVETLNQGYNFFRGLIDALRVVHGNAKDLTLPKRGTEELELLARRLHVDDAGRLEQALAQHLQATRATVDSLPSLLGAEAS